MMIRILFLVFIVVPLTAHAFTREYILHYLTSDKRLDKPYVENFLKRVKLLKPVIRLQKAKPVKWYQYKRFFVNKKHIKLGEEFLRKHHRLLGAVERKYGVSRYIIVAILGIESYYGRYHPKFTIANTLYTLSVTSRRARYFLEELKYFLIFAKKNNLDPFSIKGSYAGAVGMAQFMPDNIFKYGVDFDGDKKVDLINSVKDAVASIANFLHKHGWNASEPVVIQIKPYCYITTRSILVRRIACCMSIWPKRRFYNMKVRLLEFEERHGKSQWACFKNFFVLMRYNPSRMYALSVALLAEKLRRFHGRI